MTNLDTEYANAIHHQGIRIHAYALYELFPPNARFYFECAARGTVFCRVGDAAIGAELYRQKHGELPKKVEKLVPEFLPEVPLDPFDGQPIRYVVREDKYVFYSVGPDGKVDGAPGPPADDPHGDGPDIEFAVKRKAK